jgi:integration host factor subunit alpha
VSLTKTCIVEKVCEKTGLSKKKSAELLETLLETMKQTLESGDEILIRRFGKFSVIDTNGRKGRNPSISKELTLEALRVVTFRSSSVLIKRINEPKVPYPLVPNTTSKR